MSRSQRCLAFGLFMLLGGATGLAQEPLDLLKASGLVKSGKCFVLPEEEKVVEGLVHMGPSIGQMEQKFGIWGAIIQNEYEFQWLTDYRIGVIREYNDYKSTVNSMPASNPLQRLQKQEAAQGLIGYENEVRWANGEIALRRKRLVGPGMKQKAEDDAKKSCEDFLQAKGRVWPDVESIMKRYEELKANDSVLNALKAYNAKAQARLRLGPSDDMSRKAKKVIAIERQYSPDTAPTPKKMTRNQKLDRKKQRGSKGSTSAKSAMAEK